MKNTLKKASTASGTKRKKKNSSFTQSVKKPRSTPRYFEVNLRISAEEYNRGQPYFEDKKYLQKFFMDAYNEKVNRAESHDKETRLRKLKSNMDLLESVLIEMHKHGKLNFLWEENNGK